MARTRTLWMAIVAAACIASMSACGGSSSSDDATRSDKGTSTLKVGTITGALPYEGLDDDGKTVIGFEPELLEEAAKRIGMDVKYTILDFDALMPGVDSGRFDMVMSGFQDKPERQAKYDMLDIIMDKYTFGAQKDVAASIKTAMDVCGHSTGAVPGGAYQALFAKWNDACKAAGKPGFEVQTYDGDSQGFLAVKSGQTDFWPSAVAIIQQWADGNDGATTPLTFMENPAAWILPKDGEFTSTLQSALQSMIDDGTYDEILAKWNSSSVALDKITVNAGADVTD
jgi:polar amino acid transport system substrate-binding protein